MNQRIDTTNDYLSQSKDAIEAIIDTIGLESTLELIETICRQRFDAAKLGGHRDLCDRWMYDAEILKNAANRVSII